CDRLPAWVSGGNKSEKAEQAEAKGQLPAAVSLYENALDGTPATADIHRRLAVIYDSKLKDPISALHHYRRYLNLQAGEASPEIKSAVARLERELARKYAGATIGSSPKAANAPAPPPVDAKGFSTVPKTAAAEQLVGTETRTYKVQKGDTITAISRKFYKTADRWKDIVDANFNQLNGKPDIREGQTLIIPE
ncbi:MAG TPA: LysM peptidoglycan-binding domain-containing protein, partial [Chthoniobacterales bacterium]